MSAEPARAHVDVRPTLVEQGALAELRIELPRLRPGPPPTSLELAGPRIEVLAIRMLATNGTDTVWTARLRANGAPGVVPLVLRARYGDGRAVEVDQKLTVVPAPQGSGVPWPGVVAGSVLAGAFAVALVVARRRA